jgi:hypothetical protein
LKESQRMVDKLRNQVLDLSQQVMELEGEKSRGGAVVRQEQVDRPSLAETNNNNSEPNTHYAITCLTAAYYPTTVVE